jgi:peptidoglycan-associated lipoprotein
MKKLLLGIPVLALAVGGTTACATKGFVQGQVGEVNQKVDGLSRTVEETQERTRANEGRIAATEHRVGEVDEKAQQAGQRAEEARAAADAVNARADAIEAAAKRLVYEVVLSEDKGGFRFGQATMPETAQAEIDRLVEQLKAEPTGAYIEIEGHTDSTGPKDYNYRLGLQRAEAVKRYIYEQHQVPLHRINVISYGPDKPIAPNNTRDGRAQNRRVVIKILT